MKTVVDANGLELHVGDRVIVGEGGLDGNIYTVGKEASVAVIRSGGYDVGLIFEEKIHGGHDLGGRVGHGRGYYGFGSQVTLIDDAHVNITISFEELFGDATKI